MRLPRTIAFDDTAFPELMAIFQDIDMAIATMVATDPGFQARSTTPRRKSKAAPTTSTRQRIERRAAA